MRERCLRTQLISPILAPLRSSARVVACFSAKRDARRRRDPIGRCAAGEKNQHEIVLARRVGERQRALGAGKAGLVGDRMARFDHRQCAASAGRSHGASRRRRRAAPRQSARDNAAPPLRSASLRPCRRQARSAARAAAVPAGAAAGNATGCAAATAVRNSDSRVRAIESPRRPRLTMARLAHGKFALWKDGL